MTTVILLVSECKGVCPPSWLEAKHPTVVVDHIHRVEDALRMIPVAQPDYVVLGPGVADTPELRARIHHLAPKTRVGTLPCSTEAENSGTCVATREEFLTFVSKVAAYVPAQK